MSQSKKPKKLPRHHVVTYTVQLKPVLEQCLPVDKDYNATVTETLRQLMAEHPKAVVLPQTRTATLEDIQRLR